MATFDKLLSVLAMGGTVANISLMQRFLYGVTLVIALTAVSATILTALVVFGFYGLYVLLVHYGLAPLAAALLTAAFALIVALLLAMLAVMRWQKLKSMPHRLSGFEHYASQTVESFLQGFFRRASRR